MKLFRLALTIGGLSLLAGGLSACLKEPDYSISPEISVENLTHSAEVIRMAPKVSGGVVQDSVRITIRYQDGDGDLGLDATDLGMDKYKYPNSKNFFIEPFVKKPGSKVYESLNVSRPDLASQYNGTFPHLTSLTDSKGAPIKGTLTYAPIAFVLGLVFQPNQKVKFKVSIADRALHVSNSIMTDSIVIAPR